MSYTLPNGTTFSFDECLNELRFTRDFDLYLDMLSVLKDRLLIILNITGGDRGISNLPIKKLHNLGFLTLSPESRLYIGIINKGSVIFDNCSTKQDVDICFEKTVENLSLVVSSKSADGDICEIIINSENYSLNERGLNFVVYNCDNNSIVDSSCYDVYLPKPTFYHCNLFFNDRYIDTYIYMPQKFIKHFAPTFKHSYFSNRKLNAFEAEKAIILPNSDINGKTYGGVCDENFNLISGHQIFDTPLKSRHIWGSYRVPKDAVEYIDETVVYGGTMVNHPGQLVVESFADRIWWFLNNDDSKIKIAVVSIWSNTVWASEYAFFVKQFLSAFGLKDDRVIYIKKATQFKKVIIPDQSSIPIKLFSPYEFTNEYIQVFRHIRNNTIPAEYKKIYLTKKHTAKKNVIGEDYFIDFYKNKGFEIIAPEEYTISEKASLMYGADEVVTLDGTNSIFTVFCKPSVKLTILAKEYNNWNYVQHLITEAVGIKEFYLVNVSVNFLENNFSDGLSLICVTDEFKRYVKDVFNEELDITPKESLKGCLYDYLEYFPKHFSVPYNFNFIKNQKMLTVLQNISEIFVGKEFDTSQIDIITNEDKLFNQVKQLTADLNTYKKRITELESTDIFKAAELLEATNVKFEEQLSQIHKTQQSTIQDLQTKNEVLIGKNAGLEQSLQQKAVEINKRDATIYELSEKLLDAQSKEIELKDKIIVQEQLRQEQITKIAELEKQISDYEQLQSKRGKFFKSRKGND